MHPIQYGTFCGASSCVLNVVLGLCGNRPNRSHVTLLSLEMSLPDRHPLNWTQTLPRHSIGNFNQSRASVLFRTSVEKKLCVLHRHRRVVVDHSKKERRSPSSELAKRKLPTFSQSTPATASVKLCQPLPAAFPRGPRPTFSALRLKSESQLRRMPRAAS